MESRNIRLLPNIIWCDYKVLINAHTIYTFKAFDIPLATC
jgi:hypothetical protein